MSGARCARGRPGGAQCGDLLREPAAAEKCLTRLASLEELEARADGAGAEAAAGQREALDRLLGLVQQLERRWTGRLILDSGGMDAAAIGEITGLAPGNVATKIDGSRHC